MYTLLGRIDILEIVSFFCNVFYSTVCILETIINVFLHKYMLSICFFLRINGVSQLKQVLHLIEGKNNMETEITRLYFIFKFLANGKNKQNKTKISLEANLIKVNLLLM